MPVGLIAVIVSQAFVLSKKISQAFFNSEELTGRLELYNLQLDRITSYNVCYTKLLRAELKLTNAFKFIGVFP